MLQHLSTGPALPYGIDMAAMAPSPDGDGVILFGGRTKLESSWIQLDTIFELRADGQGGVGTWNALSANLQYARQYHIVVPILIDICSLGGTTGI